LATLKRPVNASDLNPIQCHGHGLVDQQIRGAILSSLLTEKWRQFLQERRHFSLRFRARGRVPSLPCKESLPHSMTQLTCITRPLCRSAIPWPWRTARKPVPYAFICTLFPWLPARRTSRSVPTETAPGCGSRKQGANDSSKWRNASTGFSRIFKRTLAEFRNF
jgi:hypothetical protein